MAKIDLGEYLENYLEYVGMDYITVAVDTTGLTPNGRGQWLEKKHGDGTRKKASWVKFGVLVLVDGHMLLSFVAVPNNVADIKVFKPLLEQAKKHRFKIVRLGADKAFDSRAIYEYLLKEGILPAIMSRKGGSTRNRGSPFRAELVLFMNNYSERVLRDLLNTKDRLAVERFYSIFKFIFLERLYSRKQPHILNEIKNKFILIQYYLKVFSHESHYSVKLVKSSYATT
ncbi:MAG: transposase [Promethearchaeota archaeon]